MAKRRITPEDIQKVKAYAAEIRKEKEKERQEQAEYIDQLVQRKKEFQADLEEDLQPVIEVISAAKDIDLPTNISNGITTETIIDIKSSKGSYRLHLKNFEVSKEKFEHESLMFLESNTSANDKWKTIWTSEETSIAERSNGPSTLVAMYIYVLDLIQKKAKEIGSFVYVKGTFDILRKYLFPYTKRNDGSYIEIPTPDLSR